MGRNSCRHAWALKDDQSTLPIRGQQPDLLTVYIVAAYCTECLSHMELRLDFHDETHNLYPNPCPNKEWPLHHFIYKPDISHPRQTAKSAPISGKENDWVDIQRFECSSLKCTAKLSIQVKPPRLTPESVSLLTERTLIEQRATKAITENPDLLEGHAIPQPLDVLHVLRQYITNALTKDARRKIPGLNKKWLLCLGETCSDLLLHLGFAQEVSRSQMMKANIRKADVVCRGKIGYHLMSSRWLPLLLKILLIYF